MPDSSIKRLTSFKLRVNDLLSGEFIKMEGWIPNYILTKDGRRVSRVNIIATVVSVSPESKNLAVDDGTGTINLKIFDDAIYPGDLVVADIVLVIGRVRSYEGEVFIAPEIIKKINDKRWLDVRSLEIEKERLLAPNAVIGEDVDNDGNQAPVSPSNNAQDVNAQDETQPDARKEQGAEPPVQGVYKLIKEMDNGKGADTEDIISSANLRGITNPRKIIQSLLEEGEIFEIRPGRLKVLE